MRKIISVLKVAHEEQIGVGSEVEKFVFIVVTSLFRATPTTIQGYTHYGLRLYALRFKAVPTTIQVYTHYGLRLYTLRLKAIRTTIRGYTHYDFGLYPLRFKAIPTAV